MTEALIDFEKLLGFLESLRLRGYNVGTEQYISVQNLLVTLAGSDDRVESPEALADYLGPLVCTSPEQQREFRAQFTQWLDSAARQDGRGGAEQRRPAKEVAPVKRRSPLLNFRSANKQTRRTKFLKLALAASLVAAIVAAAFILLRPSTGPPTVIEEQTTPVTDEKQVDEQPAETVTTEAPPSVPLVRIGSDAVQSEQSFYDRHHGWIRAGAAFIPLALFGAWAGSFYIRQRGLRRGQSSESPKIEHLTVKGANDQLFRDSAFRLAVQGLRRKRALNVFELDIESTVELTARKGGLFTPVFNPRKAIPEYLVLIERAGLLDHQARLQDQIISRLEEENVHLTKYYFHKDPRVCWTDDPHSPRVSLQELAARYAEHNLLVFSDGAGLIDRFTGNPQEWIEMFAQWTSRVMLTPEPVESWGYRERALSESDFILLPASAEGVALLASAILAHRANEPAGAGGEFPFPELLEHKPELWLSSDEPDAEEIDDLLLELRYYLGSEGYYWLSACAIYPMPQWEITLFLGERLTGARGLEHRVASLARLPWLREGTIPDWLRLRLIASLTPEKEAEARRAIEDLLLTALHRPQGFQLPIAHQKAGAGPGLFKRMVARARGWRDRVLLHAYIANEPASSPLKDHVFLGFLNNSLPSKLELSVPQRLARKLFNSGRASRYLGYAALGLIAVLLSASVWMAMARPDKTQSGSFDTRFTLSPPSARGGQRITATISSSNCQSFPLDGLRLSTVDSGVRVIDITGSPAAELILNGICDQAVTVDLEQRDLPDEVHFDLTDAEGNEIGFFPFMILAAEPLPCPQVRIDCPRNTQPGQPVVFKAIIDGAPLQEALSYSWTASEGEIIQGYGTDSITVNPPPGGFRSLKATVLVGGIRPECGNSMSCENIFAPVLSARVTATGRVVDLCPDRSEQIRANAIVGLSARINEQSVDPAAFSVEWIANKGIVRPDRNNPYRASWDLSKTTPGSYRATARLYDQNRQLVATSSTIVGVRDCLPGAVDVDFHALDSNGKDLPVSRAGWPINVTGQLVLVPTGPQATEYPIKYPPGGFGTPVFFSNIPPGKYNLVTRISGFCQRERPTVTVISNSTTKVTVTVGPCQSAR